MIRDLAAAFAGAARSFRRRPAFFAISTISLGLAFGFATTVFGVVDSVLHAAVPYADPDRTFTLFWWGARDKAHPGATSDEMDEAVRAIPAFDGVANSTLWFNAMLQAGERGEHRIVARVAPNFFSVTGTRQRLGRLFADDDARIGNSIVVSDAIWRAYFDDRASIGRAELSIDGKILSVIGVMPRGMNHANQYDADLWVPMAPGDTLPPGFPTVHLRPGVTQKTAEAQLATLAARLTQQYHVEARPYGFRLASLRPQPGRLGTGDRMLLAAAFGILFIACANVATMMLARAVARRRDLALRLSLGARTRTLVLDQLAEVLLLALAGGIAGMMVAFWGIAGATHAVPPEMRWLLMLDPHWSWRFFWLVLASAGGAAVLTGLLPAWQVSRIQPMEPLKESSGGTTGRTAHRIKFVVVAELATSLALLFGACLLGRSTLYLAAFDYGFDPRPIVTVSGRLTYRWDVERFQKRFGPVDPLSVLLPRVESMRGVESASVMGTGHPDRSQVFSDETTGIAPLLAGSYIIGGAHFMRTMGLRMLRGRDFEPGDEAQGAVILDERAVPILFPGGRAIGRRVRFGGDDGGAPWLLVIGVARASDGLTPRNADGSLRWPPIYASVARTNAREWGIVARVPRGAPGVLVELDRELNAVLPASARARVASFSADRDRTLRFGGFMAGLFATLGAAALALAAAGLFAVLSYAVNQRMREFGVRVALGAQRRDVLALVFRDGAEMALAGTGLGALGGFVVGTLMANALYRVEPTDVVSLLVAEAVLLLVTLGGCLAPALHATRADPIEALRAT
jgi:predicted permease